MFKYVIISFLSYSLVQAQEVNCKSDVISYKSSNMSISLSFANDGVNSGFYMSKINFTNILDLDFSERQQQEIIDKHEGRYRLNIRITSLENQTFKLYNDNLNFSKNDYFLKSIKNKLLPMLLKAKRSIKDNCSKDVLQHTFMLPIFISIQD